MGRDFGQFKNELTNVSKQCVKNANDIEENKKILFEIKNQLEQNRNNINRLDNHQKDQDKKIYDEFPISLRDVYKSMNDINYQNLEIITAIPGYALTALI